MQHHVAYIIACGAIGSWSYLGVSAIARNAGLLAALVATPFVLAGGLALIVWMAP